ncbi:hypothetical protein NCCP2716_29270 [Sporosarcina sp. NCCP-2716]|uniref:hypothetical protein n=1 Tax=Sporosarcina sp. NCCP-2716 TaxID=2943679 RepID=UPI00203CA631|nr:hypothetical protein [Sporosarcina sp. NCCP-2716]GKV70429.1 hypothetical protein NCCP2716_29270 [Sporosarcina sp. NCCP-2716]
MKKIIILLFTIMLLTACSEAAPNNHIFTGESEHWEAEYTYNGIENWGEKDEQKTDSNAYHFRFVLKYKGSLEELSSLQKIEYSYETNGDYGSDTEEFAQPLVSGIFALSGSSESREKVLEDAVIKVNVRWDGFEESFVLQNNSK